MNNTPSTELVYHVKYARPLRGCLWLFIFLAIVVTAALLLCVKVVLPEPMPPAKEANVQYRSDELLHLQILMRSPMPLPLSAAVDPARREEAASQALPSGFSPRLRTAPPQRVFRSAHDSAALDASDLLAFPPEGMSDTPVQPDGEEVQP